MQKAASVARDDADAPYLLDPAVYYLLPTYNDLVDAAASAEMQWLNVKATGREVELKRGLADYTGSLVPRRCRLSGTLLACTRVSGGHAAHKSDLYVKIRLSAPCATYRDRIYECHYPWASFDWALATIRDLSEAKIGDDLHLFGRVERSFTVPGFFLARARVYRGPTRSK